MADLQEPFDELSDGERTDGPVAEVGAEEHISFVQRLESHFGQSVDPEIDLQEGEHDSGDQVKLSKEPSERESSSSSRALMRKLAESVQLGARFKVKREIARGGMGIIFRVWDQDLRRNLAMKVMHSNSSLEASSRPEDLDQEKLGRFLEEAQITGQLDHPGIVPVHDLGIDTKGRCYFTMRLVRGRELKEVLDLMRAGKENWTRTKVLSLVLKICESMAFAHSKGVVHRDLKPQNVMVGRFGEVYVMDWGLARVLGRRDSHDIRLRPEADEPSSLSLVRTVRKDDSEANPDSSLVTMDGDVVGTPSFMAVEQAQGKLEQVGVRSDVYSLGAILYYMLTGRSPYVTPGERASPHTVLNRVLQGPPDPVSMHTKDQPAELVAICEKAMHRDASQRYGSMLDVAEDIQAYLEDRVVGAYEGGAFAEARKLISRNRGVSMISAAMVVLVFVTVIGFATMKQLRVSDLEASDIENKKLLVRANASEDKAKQETAEAKRQKGFAEANLKKAETAGRVAIQHAEQASRAGYRTRILAAEFSLRLDDVAEARAQLRGSGISFRDWEYNHLDLRTRNAVVSIDSLRKSVRVGGSDSYASHRRPIDQVGWLGNGGTLALMTREGWMRFMKPVSGAPALGDDLQLKHFSALNIAGGFVPSMSFNANESKVALVGFDNVVHVYDANERTLLMELPLSGDPGHAGRVTQVAWSMANGRMITGSDKGEVIFWGSDGSMGVVTGRQGFGVSALAWSPDGDHWAAGFSDGVVLVRESSLPEFDIHRLEGHAGQVNALAFSADGQQIFSAGEDGKLNTWTSRQGRLVASYSGHHRSVTCMDYDPIHGRVVTGSRDQTLRVWDMQSGQSRVLLGHEAGLLGVSFSADGRFLASCALDGSVKTWDAFDDSSITDLEAMPAGVSALAFDPSGRFLASADELGNLLLWDAQAGLVRAKLRGHRLGSEITALAFELDGSHLFSASEDKTVRRWNTSSGRQSSVYRHAAEVHGLGVGLEGNELFTTSGNFVINWDIQTRIENRSFEASSHRVTGLGLSNDGEWLACTDSTSLILWDAEGRGESRSFELLGSQGVLAISPNAKLVLSVTRKGELRAWNLEGIEGTPMQLERSGSVSAIAFHPKGRRFASGSRDGSVRIWDANTGEILLTLHWPDENIQSIAFDLDGARLVTGSKSGAIRIWETDLVGQRRKRGFEERELRAALQPELDRLFDLYYFVSDVLNAIDSKQDLDSKQRVAAKLLANLRGDDPGLHAAAAFAVAMRPDASGESFDKARLQARAALQMSAEPHQPALLLALGMACYRAEEISEASTWLVEAQRRQEALEDQSLVLDVPLDAQQRLVLTLFQALASLERGNPQEAIRFYDQASLVIQGSDLASLSPELSDLVNEVGAALADS